MKQKAETLPTNPVFNIRVVNKHHNPEAMNEENSFYVGRGSPLGNPFKIGDSSDDGTNIKNRAEVISEYDIWLEDQIKSNNQTVLTELERIGQAVLNGKAVTLVCFCAPSKCHADIIKRQLVDAIRNAQS